MWERMEGEESNLLLPTVGRAQYSEDDYYSAEDDGYYDEDYDNYYGEDYDDYYGEDVDDDGRHLV